MHAPRHICTIILVLLTGPGLWAQCSATWTEDFDTSVVANCGGSTMYIDPQVWSLGPEWFGQPGLGSASGPQGFHASGFFSGTSATESGGLQARGLSIVGEANPQITFSFQVGVFDNTNFPPAISTTAGDLRVQQRVAGSWTTVWSNTGHQPNWQSASATFTPGSTLEFRFQMAKPPATPFLSISAAIDEITVCGVPIPEWQANTPMAGLRLNGRELQDPLHPDPTLEVLSVGEVGALALASTLTGNPFDVILSSGVDVPLPSSAGGFLTSDSELVHISPAWPSVVYLNGGLAPDLFNTSVANVSLPVSLLSPGTISGQMGVVNPSNLSGISFSQATQVEIIPVPLANTLPLTLGDDEGTLISAASLGLASIGPGTFYGKTYVGFVVSSNGVIQLLDANWFLRFQNLNCSSIPGNCSVDGYPGPPFFNTFACTEFNTLSPKIGILSDLDPTAGGTIEVITRSNGDVSVVYTNVPEWNGPGVVSFSIDLEVSGAVAIRGFATNGLWGTGGFPKSTAAGIVMGSDHPNPSSFTPYRGTLPSPTSFDGAAGLGVQTGVITDRVMDYNPNGMIANTAGWTDIVFPNGDGSAWYVQ